MKFFYNLRSFFSATKNLTLLAQRLVMLGIIAGIPFKLFGQAPAISYSGAQVYNAGTAIAPLAPTATGVAALGYSSPVAVGSGFNHVNVLVADPAGNVFVCDNKFMLNQYGGGGDVAFIKQILASDGSTVSLISDTHPVWGLGEDAAGNLYIADVTSQIIKVPAGGGIYNSVKLGSGFYNAKGVAIDGAGNVYVADNGNYVLKKIPAGNGAVETIWTDGWPAGVATDAAGNLYVDNDAGAGSVYKIPANGGAPFQLITGEGGLATDAGGNLFIGGASIRLIPAGGTNPITISSGYANAAGITVDPSQNVYMACAINDTTVGVKKIKPVGGYFISPALPAGLSFDNNTGIISGTPTKSSPATTYTIIAFNSSGKTTTTVSIQVNNSTNATLSNIALSNGSITAFNPVTTSYAVSVGSGVSSITVTPTASSNMAAITVNGTTVVSGTASGSIPIQTGVNNITIVVTAPDGITQKTYSLTVNRPSTNSLLSDLTLSAGTLSQSFSPAINNYSVTVANGVKSLSLTSVTAVSQALIKINGLQANDGAPSSPIQLNVGANTVTVLVTAPDGITQSTYTLTVTRQVALPFISYNSPQTFAAGNAVALTPISSGVDAWGYDRNPVTIGSGYGMPIGVAADGAGNIYALDFVNKAIVKIPAGGGAPIVIAQGLNSPRGMTCDAAGNIFVCDSNNNAIKKIAAGTYAVTTIGTGFNSPQAVAVDGAGNVYVADNGNGAIKKIPAGGGAVITVKTGFANIAGVAIDAAGNIYAADAGISTGTLYEIPAPTPGGSTDMVAIGTGLGRPSGVVTDAAGNVYVCDLNKSTAIKISPDGSQFIIGAGFTFANGIAIDNAGNVYIADFSHSAIKEVKITGGYFLQKSLPAGLSFNNETGTISGVPLPVAASPAADYPVTAYNSGGSKTVTVNIGVTVSANANLSDLSVNGATLSPTFAAGTINYTANVSNVTASVTLRPTAAEAHATIKINGVTAPSDSTSGAIALSAGANTINVVVTAQDGTTTKTYTVTVTRALSSNAGLSALSISSGALSPTFSTGTISYADTVNNSTASVTVTPTQSDVNATIKVNGTTVASGSPSGAIALSAGANNINIAVTAQDGTTIKTYTVTVVRKSNDATLSALTLSKGTLSPVFAPTTITYTATVVNSVASITLTPTKNNTYASISVNGSTVSSGAASAAQALMVGTNAIKVVVTAQNGAVKTYTVTVIRQSNDATLSALTLSSGALNPVFASTTVNYTASVANATSSITLTPAKNNAYASISINGSIVSPGHASAAQALAVGANPIKVIVTAQNGAMKTYTVTVTRLAASVMLSNLSISTGTLSPSFSSGTTGYADTVNNSTASVTVTPTQNNASAVSKVNGTVTGPGTASASIPLTVGLNTIKVVVTSVDGTATYTIKVVRKSNDATLSGLTLSSGTLSPVFAGTTVNYTAPVSNAISSITLTPTKNNAYATIAVNGSAVISGTESPAQILAVGANFINVAVTAQNGAVKTYNLTITRSAASLNSLYLPGGSEQTPLVSPLNDKVEANNILSPNGDGINDIWVVKNIAFYPNNTVSVYSRTGEVVFTKKGYANDWDGAYRGSVLSQGTYYYLVDLGNGKSVKGFITVVSH